jgi:AcrR family transcriptional regulator
VADEVKRRPYRSAVREQQARTTRRAVTDAAQARFAREGYAATTLQQIAADAGVSVQTIYATFRTKRQLLGDVLDVAIAGDDQPVAVNDRDWMQTALQDPDAAQRLVAYAAAVRRIFRGAGDMFAVLRDAASVDADLRELAATADRNRRAGAKTVVRGIASLGALRPGLDEPAAVDIVWTLNSPDVYQMLVRRCGWSTDAYEAWLATTLRQQLLDPATVSGPP